MDVVIIVLSLVAVISAIGALFSRDNFYSAIYLAITLLAIGGIYAEHGVYSVFALIAFIFIGAIVIITIAIAATYRFLNPRKINILWLGAIEILAIIVAVTAALNFPALSGFTDAFSSVLSNYMSLITFLVVLTTLIMLSAVSMVRRDSV
uniref:NADH-quinone oxidoreductase subunit J n=1 Tax=Geoglobus ahangari TaxID=113653 RepID=A0A7C3YP74_9EURY